MVVFKEGIPSKCPTHSGFRNNFPRICSDSSEMACKTTIYCIPRIQMTLVLIEEGLIFGGLIFKNRGQLGSRYIYIILSAYNWIVGRSCVRSLVSAPFELPCPAIHGSDHGRYDRSISMQESFAPEKNAQTYIGFTGVYNKPYTLHRTFK